jgi:hypothetical protein
LLTIGILLVWLIIWQGGGFMLKGYLGKKDRTGQIDQLIDVLWQHLPSKHQAGGRCTDRPSFGS